MHYSRSSNVSGPHPLIPCLNSFLPAAMITFHQSTLNSDIHKSTLIHSGMFTISCVKRWMKNSYSALALACLMTPPQMIRTMPNSHFLIFAPVDLAKVEILLGELLMKVR